jgi:predicted esterase
MVELVERLELPGVACVAPAAPDGSWYPQRFFEPREVNEPELSSTLDMIDALLDDLAARGVPPERTLLGGFSQGACLAAEAVARRPRPLGALAVICGGLFGIDGDELMRPAPGSLEGLPVLLTGAEDDEWVPLVRVWLSADVFGAAGADVDLVVSGPGEHGIRDAEVEALRGLVAGLVAGG